MKRIFAILASYGLQSLAFAQELPRATGINEQNALHPAGPQAHTIFQFWNFTVLICTVVFAAVVAALLYALWRAPRSTSATAPDLAPLEVPERGAKLSVVAAIALSIALLLVLIVMSFRTDRALARLPLSDALSIQVTAKQWWWDVRYDDPQASNMFSTANEIHIPVGRPIVIKLQSNDVIHSFWVPNLHGKKDLIPGRPAVIQFRADKAGVYRGQCAEFCGLQHARMAFVVVAEPQEQYEAWVQAQRQTAPEPSNERQAKGRDIFLTRSCAMCHAIQGTQANARFGPDLTHIASRPTLAAGTLPNTREHLSTWISDPQSIKPGSNMPSTALNDDEREALLDYLGSLQ